MFVKFHSICSNVICSNVVATYRRTREQRSKNRGTLSLSLSLSPSPPLHLSLPQLVLACRGPPLAQRGAENSPKKSFFTIVWKSMGNNFADFSRTHPGESDSSRAAKSPKLSGELEHEVPVCFAKWFAMLGADAVSPASAPRAPRSARRTGPPAEAPRPFVRFRKKSLLTTNRYQMIQS